MIKGVCRNPMVNMFHDKGLTTVSPKVRTSLFGTYAKHCTGTPGGPQGARHSTQHNIKAASEERRNYKAGVGKMAQKLKVHTAFVEDPSLLPSTHNHLTPPMVSMGTYTHVHRYTYTYTYI